MYVTVRRASGEMAISMVKGGACLMVIYLVFRLTGKWVGNEGTSCVREVAQMLPMESCIEVTVAS